MAKFRSESTLPERVRDGMANVIQSVLYDATDLALMARQCHWNVRGKDFGPLHAFFGTLYDALGPLADDLAERVAALGGPAAGTARATAQATRLPEFPGHLYMGCDLVRELAPRWAAVANAARYAASLANEMDDQASVDLLGSAALQLDKLLWQLEAHLEGEGES